jgi:F-type H+-transporting ATPase subunit c
METRVRRGDAAQATGEFVIVPLAAGEENGATVRALGRVAGSAALRGTVAATRFRGREGQTATIPVAGRSRRVFCLVGLGAAIGVGLAGSKAAEAVGRNPGAFGKVFTTALIAMALAEGLAILAFFVVDFSK